jgi:hypothetical protein
VGIFSLGIIPYINSSIVLQLFSAAFPSLKKLQREEGPQGRATFQYYQKLLAFVFAIVQVRSRASPAAGGCTLPLAGQLQLPPCSWAPSTRSSRWRGGQQRHGLPRGCCWCGSCSL